jgi:23S rRNA (pseudouridine1915-N3)-methyltransferase
VHEVEDKKGGGMAAEAALLGAALPKGAVICAMDERGKVMSSPDFAKSIARYRDNGSSDLAFIIGGADGIDPSLRERADMSLSFGQMVWPHMLARVMLSEQLYRAASILAGSPYHRV